LEHDQRALPIMGLITGLFAEVVMPLLRRFESLNATRKGFLQLGQIINPVTPQAKCISDQLPPNGSAYSISDRWLESQFLLICPATGQNFWVHQGKIGSRLQPRPPPLPFSRCSLQP